MIIEPFRRKLHEHSVDELCDLLENPTAYNGLLDDELDQFAHFAIGLYGSTGEPSLVPKVMELYQYYQERISVEQRLQNYQVIRDQIMSGDIVQVFGLLPFVLCDYDAAVVSSASLDYAVLYPPSDDDPLSGAKELVQFISQGLAANPPAVFGGLLTTGDARIIGLLAPIRSDFNNDNVEEIIRCRSGFIFKATADFLVNWLDELLENNDEVVFGTVAAGLVNQVRGAQKRAVFDVERVIPSTPDEGLRLLKELAIEEYAKQIAPRLRSIARREQGDRIMHHVLGAWGITE
jgi:hypothetical protein